MCSTNFTRSRSQNSSLKSSDVEAVVRREHLRADVLELEQTRTDERNYTYVRTRDKRDARERNRTQNIPQQEQTRAEGTSGEHFVYKARKGRNCTHGLQSPKATLLAPKRAPRALQGRIAGSLSEKRMNAHALGPGEGNSRDPPTTEARTIVYNGSISLFIILYLAFERCPPHRGPPYKLH
jgi:hypothetical protein